jgi:tRNA A-37 threonylcarbamoyl transferase component Bud32
MAGIRGRREQEDTMPSAARAPAPVRRRPSGEPPPFPREDRWTRWIWVLVAVLLVGVGLSVLIQATDLVQTADEKVLEFVAGARTPALIRVARLVELLTTFAAVIALRWAIVVVLVVYRRFRHLVVFLATLVVTDWVVVRLLSVQLPRPTVPVLVDTDTYAFPSRPISGLAITLYAASFVLLPRGRGRNRLRAGIVAALVLVGLAELYLAADYLSGMVYAAVLAPCVVDVAFRWLVPEEGFPITYRLRGNAAHLDLGGDRGKAIVRAMTDQLGLTVTEIKEFGLEGSGGSSPLRMTVQDGSRVFGKIYSTSHERADRWYRFGRTILYGQLEDETAIGSVRRLAAYEDYALRLLADYGVRVARTYGLVELTPNQEYMLVTEFFENATNLGDAEIDDMVIDEGLGMIRTFWDIGVAHRDIKPANLLVRDGHLQLVDVSGLEVRPSPWRQAVDLSNMLLVLALRTDPERVYARAAKVFTPEEIAEAIASAVGLTIPTELQARMKADGRPLLERFRQLTPPRERISIQRWSAQRLLLTAGAVLGTLLLVGLFIDSLRAGLP